MEFAHYKFFNIIILLNTKRKHRSETKESVSGCVLGPHVEHERDVPL